MYECPICLDDYTHDKLKIMICGHKICTGCEILLIESGQYEYCPMCRIPLRSYIDLTNYMSESDVIGHVVEHVQLPPLSVSSDAVLFYMDESDHDQFERQQQRGQQPQQRGQQRGQQRHQHYAARRNAKCRKCQKVIINFLYCVLILAVIIIVLVLPSL